MSNVRTGKDRFIQEQIGRPLWDAVYRSVWGNNIEIERDLGEWQEHQATDVKITHPRYAFPLYGQEKTLGYFWGTQYDTVTVEHWQVPDIERGDAFRIGVQFYACAYLNEAEDNFSHGVVADWPRVVRLTWRGGLRWWPFQNKPPARASGLAANIPDIPSGCYYWRRER